MRQFAFDNTCVQRDEAICYAHHPDIQEASLDELKVFLVVLLKYFPHTVSDSGITKPLDENLDYTKQWRAAYDHVNTLIAAHKASRRHWQVVGISFATLIVLSVTLAHRLLSKEPTGVHQAPIHTPAKSNEASSKLAK